jgi:tRNA 2-selenouridine synthase
MSATVGTDDFLELSRSYTVFDVRTPAEFEKGHIPGAINLPLFTNEDRVVIGTLYKQQGRQPAILKGLELVGPKLQNIVATVTEKTAANTVLVHCWRGGMRSGSVGWLLNLYGFKVHTLKGGYKAFRRKVIGTFENSHPLQVLGGKTGSAKSRILRQLKELGEQVIDLENLACHKGSSFGHLGEPIPPTQEMFENYLGWTLMRSEPGRKIWIEDESQMIGTKVLPKPFYAQLREAPVTYLNVAFDTRVKYLTESYGKFDPEALIEATRRIEKRLGPEQTKTAVALITEGKMSEACAIILRYYDKTYDFGLSKREPARVHKIDFDPLLDNDRAVAVKIVEMVAGLH